MLFKKYFLFLVIALSLTSSSCSVFKAASVAPTFNAAIVQDVTDLGKIVDQMYLNMEHSEDKTYETYSPDYNSAETLINSIIIRNGIRENNKAVLQQAKLYQEMLVKVRGEHAAKNKLNNSEIRIYKSYLAAQLKPLFVSEMSLK